MSTADPNLVILTGENPFIRLAATDTDDYTTNASFWRIIFSPGGPGHVLYLKSELIDNIAMARWLQDTVQGMLNGELKDKSIPVTDGFSKTGDYRSFWTEKAVARGEEVALTWFDLGDSLLIHTQPFNVPERPYGVCTVLVPALGTQLTLNGKQAAGKSWKREREKRPISTSALAFSESWTSKR